MTTPARQTCPQAMNTTVRFALKHSKGKGGRLVLELLNEFVYQELPLARVYDYEQFFKAWNDRTEHALIIYEKAKKL